jgi:hypothetical protein
MLQAYGGSGCVADRLLVRKRRHAHSPRLPSQPHHHVKSGDLVCRNRSSSRHGPRLGAATLIFNRCHFISVTEEFEIDVLSRAEAAKQLEKKS